MSANYFAVNCEDTKVRECRFISSQKAGEWDLIRLQNEISLHGNFIKQPQKLSFVTNMDIDFALISKLIVQAVCMNVRSTCLFAFYSPLYPWGFKLFSGMLLYYFSPVNIISLHFDTNEPFALSPERTTAESFEPVMQEIGKCIRISRALNNKITLGL